MSFNINKLVQPECGGSNPLVSAAQQISMRPGTSKAQVANPAEQVRVADFFKEFMQMKINPSDQVNFQQQHHGPSIQQPCSSSQITNMHAPSSAFASKLNPTLFYPNMMNQSVMPSDHKTNAIDQLEAKYRKDILAQEKSGPAVEVAMKDEKSVMPEEKTAEADPKGDVEFWRDLAQKYIGPLTNDDSKLETEDDYITAIAGDITFPTESEYTFDERNPFKDHFADPFSEGLKRLEMGDIPSAVLLFEAAVLKAPTHAEAWRYLGTTNAQNEMDRLAIRALNKCLELNPSDQEARLSAAVSLANENRKYSACQQLLKWLVSNPRYTALATDYVQFEKDAETMTNDIWSVNPRSKIQLEYTLKKFLEAANMSPSLPDADVQCSLGVLFNLQGDYDKAVDCFKVALSVKSEDSKLWNRLGATLANGGKNDEAILAYRKALELAPGFLRCRYNLAISLIHMSLYDEAGKQLVQILNTQAAGQDKFSNPMRARSITSNSIWETMRTVTTLMNRPDLYHIIESRDLAACNQEIFQKNADRPFVPHNLEEDGDDQAAD